VAPTTTIFRGERGHLKNVVNLLEKLQPDYFAREVEKIFRRAWLPLVSASALPNKSDYVVVEVPPLKASLLVVRGDDGRVRAFHNICRHRGNKLVQNRRGCAANGFTCGFHAWTFA